MGAGAPPTTTGGGPAPGPATGGPRKRTPLMTGNSSVTSKYSAHFQWNLLSKSKNAVKIAQHTVLIKDMVLVAYHFVCPYMFVTSCQFARLVLIVPLCTVNEYQIKHEIASRWHAPLYSLFLSVVVLS